MTAPRAARHLPTVGLPPLTLPKLCPSSAALLRAQPPRRADEDAVGRPLYLPRLGATVLPHQPVVGGWLCTLVAVDGGGALPVGVCAVCDLELRTALAVANPWYPLVGLTGREFGDLWALRLAEFGPRLNPMFTGALLAGVDPESLQVATAPQANPGLAKRALMRSAAGVRNGCDRLADAGYLVRLFSDETDEERRYSLAVPPSPWPSG